MVFSVGIDDRRTITLEQRERLAQLAQDVVALDGERARYRPVELGDRLLVSVNAGSEADAQRVVAEVLRRDPGELTVTARDSAPSTSAGSGAGEPTPGNRRGPWQPLLGESGPRAAADLATAVGGIIRARRESRALSLRAFARRCELSPAHVSKIERGLASPSLAALSTIVNELDLHGANLFGRVVRGDGDAQVIRAADAPCVPGAHGGELRVAAQTSAATVVLASGGSDEFPESTTSPLQLITVVFAGAVELRVGDELVTLEAGDTLIVPALVPCSLRVTGGPDTRLAYISSGDGLGALATAGPAA